MTKRSHHSVSQWLSHLEVFGDISRSFFGRIRELNAKINRISIIGATL